MAKTRSIATLSIDGTVLCCNFVNTVSSWTADSYYDYLQTYDDFIAWCLKLEVADRQHLQMLNQLAVVQPDEATVALKRIKEIRQVLHGLISAVATNDNDKRQQFLPAANLLLVDAVSRQRLLYHDGRFLIDHVYTSGDLLAPIWKVVNSLGSLLTEHEANRIKECPKCGWVFLDATKNASRKWCNPRYCGSSDKMKRYNQKKENNSSEHTKK